MEKRRIGSHGPLVSTIALGSWLTLGSRVEGQRASSLVRRAVDLGVRLFDTADVYQNGAAEEALGRALRGLPRESIVVASKSFFPMPDWPDERGLSRAHVLRSVEGSLRRLATAYLDLHQCHRPDPDVPIEETVRAYADLIRKGKVRHWGVSHFSAAELREACRAADGLGAPRPVSSQPEYSIVRRRIEHSETPACAELGIGQIVFSPLAQGVLSGKYRGGHRPAGSRAGDARRGRFMGDYLNADALAATEALRPLAGDLGVSLSQLALAWCLREPTVSSVITGATNTAQLEENCAASDLVIPADVLHQIDEIAPAPAAAGSPI